MQRARWLVLILSSLLAHGTSLSAQTSAQDCPYPAPSFDPRALWHRISVRAEAIAPTAAPAARRRAVIPVAPLPIANFIDRFIAAKLQTAGVSPTRQAGDEEFLRRVTLDLTGEIPDPATVNAFVSDPSADKRARKIDELLASEAFNDRWTMWFGDLVQNVEEASNINLFYNGRNTYYSWIYNSIAGHKPYDRMIRELLSGGGDSESGPAANYVARQFATGPPQDLYDNLAADAGQKFLAMPLLCLSCHSGVGHLETVNSYLKGKTRQDFWQTAAFFSRTELAVRTRTDPLGQYGVVSTYFISDNDTGRYDLNTTDGNKSPRVPLPGQPDYVLPAFILSGEAPAPNENYRVAFARILTSNRQFARAAVNYLWKEMFGIGLVEPAGAFDLAKLTSQPSHPELLEALTDEFISDGYDLRSLLRVIANSSTYQLSSKYSPTAWSEAWVPLHARHYPHLLQAEMIFDEIAKATNVAPSLVVTGLPPFSRAMQLPDTAEPWSQTSMGRFLDQLGRGNRDDVPRTVEGSVLETLALLNDSFVTTRVQRTTPNSTIAKILASTSDPGSIVDQIYLATLSRRPTADERQIGIESLKYGSLADNAEDLQYALINSLEFLFD